MKTRADLIAAFLPDLMKVLKKHRATLSLESVSCGYHDEYHIELYIPKTWDEDGLITSEGVSEHHLPSSLDGDSL